MTRFELFFALIVVAIWTTVQRYGVMALVTGQTGKVKHAAVGRATRRTENSMHWSGASHRAEGLHTPASALIERLRSEREARSQHALAA